MSANGKQSSKAKSKKRKITHEEEEDPDLTGASEETAIQPKKKPKVLANTISQVKLILDVKEVSAATAKKLPDAVKELDEALQEYIAAYGDNPRKLTQLKDIVATIQNF